MKLTMRKLFAIVGLFLLGALTAAAYQYRSDLVLIPLVAIILAMTGSFWIFLLATVSIFFIVSGRRKWPRWKRMLGAAAMVVPAGVATGLWFLLFVHGPLFNLAAPLTGEFTVYHAECTGWVFRPGEGIGDSGTCYGSYKYLGGSTTYAVDVPHQKVWMWQEPAMVEEPKGGWVSLTQPSADRGVKSTCEVRDNANWACTVSDQHGTSITQLIGGREHYHEYGTQDLLERFANALARCDVQVDAVTWSRLELGLGLWKLKAWPLSVAEHRLSAEDWIDCTNPPP
jgi:hypothetical protein